MSGLEGAGDASLLFVVGTDQPERLKIEATRFSLGGTTDLYKLLGKGQPYNRLHMTPNYFRQARRPELSAYSCILNLITEPEENSRVLENLRKLLRGLPGKVVNHPDAVRRSTRDQVAKQLAGTPGLLVPRAVRLRGSKPAYAVQLIERAGLTFPLILRRIGTHTGKIVGLFDSAGETAAALEDDGDHIATEFVDFASPDGLYRKYRVFFIGRHIIFRHMLVSESWNVHAKDRKRVMAERPDLLEEEERLFGRTDGAFPDGVHETLHAVRKRMALDFFGMDFGLMKDGRVLLFEANATMNFLPFLPDPQFEYVKRCEAPARQALRELLGLAPAPVPAFDADRAPA
ncbi:MAG: ATP-grasp domain-containing protein [Sphingomicrobium sp.]